MDLKSKIILISGPTASGKSSFAIKLAKKIKGEIINADSMQVYKEFSILSSRPNKYEIKKTKHHLYGIVSVKKYFSAGDWLKEVKKKVNYCLIMKEPWFVSLYKNHHEVKTHQGILYIQRGIKHLKLKYLLFHHTNNDLY